MTNEEAIKNIVAYTYFNIEDIPEEVQKAFDIAITALKEKQNRTQGEWTDLSTDGRHIGWIACSVCGQEPPNESNLRTDFCPNCGAKMKGDKE